MALISISDLTFTYDGSYDCIFSGVSFNIDTKWKLGLCGRNGRGKTTLLKLLTGQYEYRGKISANVNFSYFPFDVANRELDTIDVISSIAMDCSLWEVKRELSVLDFDESALYRPYLTLSSGEQVKVLLCSLFLRENGFLLIDEPTNHLDMNARETVAKYLDSKSGYILVSHDRSFLDACIDHIMSINKKNIEIQRGNFSSWFQGKERQDTFEIAENAKHSAQIDRLASAYRANSDWAAKVEKSKKGTGPVDRGYIGHKSAKMMKRAKSVNRRREREIEEKSKLLSNIETSESVKLHPQPFHSSRLVSLEKVTVSYGNQGVFSGLNFVIDQGDRVALLGKNGSGKSSLLKLVCGDEIPYTGEVRISRNLIISYIPQDTSFLTGDLKTYCFEKNIDEPLFKAILRKLDFSRVQFEKDISDFSAGQKKKVLLATSLCQRAHLYIWDEPLNYIDVLSRIQIEDLITKYKPTMLFVEHDKAFCGKIATKSINL
ncbi:MAG: ABC-F type ribosomal protection protein [Oscillospiraceae bacterium]|nr:ABC-F type ribosomal protection protein [Oscillospiraceae bacterium]